MCGYVSAIYGVEKRGVKITDQKSGELYMPDGA
jgi:hypothetical protein